MPTGKRPGRKREKVVNKRGPAPVPEPEPEEGEPVKKGWFKKG